jgi:hypothetical protein
LETDKAFGLGLMYGQIAVHCEHVLSGGKLAAQLGCSRDNVGLACDAIIAVFADSQYRNIGDSLYDYEITLWHS